VTNTSNDIVSIVSLFLKHGVSETDFDSIF